MLAIEDQSYYSHPGVNPVSVIRSVIVNAVGGNSAPLAAARSRSSSRECSSSPTSSTASLPAAHVHAAAKVQEAVMSLVLERRASKDEILELYLNDVYLGQRGSFAIHGVAEASRLFFGKDVSNLTRRRGCADCRRHSEPGPALAVRQPEERRRPAQRRAARDG